MGILTQEFSRVVEGIGDKAGPAGAGITAPGQGPDQPLACPS